MKVRKLAVALALAGGLSSGVAQALGLGEIELQSYLNEPLEADIELSRSSGLGPDDVFVNVASEREYERVGLSRDPFLSRLAFNVVTTSDGSLAIEVSSSEPLREPYVSFLLEVTWPSGRLMREYSLLVDPPVYAEESGLDERVQAPAAASAPEPERRVTGSGTRTQQPQAASQPARDSGGRSFGPTGASDTLWTIAQSVRPDSNMSVQQVMLALQDLNPEAFINGNINRLKRGEVLRIPDRDQILSRSFQQASSEVAAQNQALSQNRREVDATAGRQAPADTAASTADDELKLVVADDSDARSQEEGGSAGGDAAVDGGVDAGQAVALEEMDRVQRENEELNSRLSDLEDQVETLRRLIELKDTQLAEMQQSAGDEAGAVADAEAGNDGASAAAPGEAGEAGGTEAGDGAVAVDADATGADAGDAGAAAGETAEAAPAAEANNPTGEEPVSAEPTAAPAEADTDPAPAPVAERGFLGSMMDLIAGNFLYQLALGGLLILLLLLVLAIARRRASQEKDFFAQLEEEGSAGSGGFDLSLGDDEEQAWVPEDPLEEADAYLSRGHHDVAAEILESAISREPSRSDLRLRLLAVYADAGDHSAFDKQFREVEAMEDDTATAEALALRNRLNDTEATPSMDELESQLRSTGFGSADAMDTDSESGRWEDSPANRDNDLMTAFDDLDLDDTPAADEPEALRAGDAKDAPIEFDLSDFEAETGDPAQAGGDPVADRTEAMADAPEADKGIAYDPGETAVARDELTRGASTDDELSLELDDEFGSLELDDTDTTDEDDRLSLDSDSGTDESPRAGADTAGDDDLDESFLDELDAELEKVAGEDDSDATGEDEDTAVKPVDDTLEDLELDVSDEDLALMDEVTDDSKTPADDDKPVAAGDDLSLDEELGLTDAFADDDDDDQVPEVTETADRNPDSRRGQETTVLDDLDESDLGDDDDFDFLAGADEAATKLDLARAYVEMGDAEGAREIIEEVILEGNDTQQQEARELLKNLS